MKNSKKDQLLIWDLLEAILESKGGRVELFELDSVINLLESELFQEGKIIYDNMEDFWEEINKNDKLLQFIIDWGQKEVYLSIPLLKLLTLLVVFAWRKNDKERIEFFFSKIIENLDQSSFSLPKKNHIEKYSIPSSISFCRILLMNLKQSEISVHAKIVLEQSINNFSDAQKVGDLENKRLNELIIQAQFNSYLALEISGNFSLNYLQKYIGLSLIKLNNSKHGPINYTIFFGELPLEIIRLINSYKINLGHFSHYLKKNAGIIRKYPRDKTFTKYTEPSNHAESFNEGFRDFGEHDEFHKTGEDRLYKSVLNKKLFYLKNPFSARVAYKKYQYRKKLLCRVLEPKELFLFYFYKSLDELSSDERTAKRLDLANLLNIDIGHLRVRKKRIQEKINKAEETYNSRDYKNLNTEKERLINKITLEDFVFWQGFKNFYLKDEQELFAKLLSLSSREELNMEKKRIEKQINDIISDDDIERSEK